MKLFQGLIEPNSNNDFNGQINDFILKLKEWLTSKEFTINQVVSLNVFLKASSNKEYYSKRQEISRILAQEFTELLPVAYLAQPPANTAELIVEIHALAKDSYSKFIIKTIDNISYILVMDEKNKKSVFATGIEDLPTNEDILKNSEKVFQKIEKILNEENLSFSDIVRQWNYIENIILERQTKDGIKQPYQQFNDVRSTFYRKSKFDCGYPSATGIGTNAGGTIISFYAIEPSSEIKIKPIDNPLQVSAYNYTEEVLVGEAIDHSIGKTSPKFVRAKYIGSPGGEVIFVSGTASIRGEETVAVDDLKGQIEITLENIEELFSKENLKISTIQPNGKVPCIIFLRGYIKNIHDYECVMKICRDKYPEVPIALVHSDICRNNLLLEIEATIGFNNTGSAR